MLSLTNLFPLSQQESNHYLTKSLCSGTDSFISLLDGHSRLKPSQNVVSLFTSTARTCPTAVAVDAGIFQITYGELDELSSQVASCLAPYVVPGQPIPFLTELSASAIIGILAILKAGGTYVPIDCSQWPEEHIAHVLDVVGGAVLLYSDQYAQLSRIGSRYPTTIAVSQRGHGFLDQCDIGKDCAILKGPILSAQHNFHDLACVIFTSGTTGSPKGVMIRHEALTNFVASRKFYLNLSQGSRSLLTLSISFDACNGYLFSSLAYGATVVLAYPDTLQDRFSTCSVVVLTPSMLKSLIPPSVSVEEGELQTSYRNLRTIILGGETASEQLLSAWYPSAAPWTAYNDYGPTEATCAVLTGVFYWNNSLAKFETSLLGLPIPGAIVKLQDKNGDEITTTDREGEIMIGGICLAHGYWQDMDRTAERFVIWNRERYYRTGDCGRWSRSRDQARIVFLGRRDRMVKNRGFLVNLETEVDAVVLNPEQASTWGISGAFTVMVDGHMCMLVSPSHVDVLSLRKWMGDHLPAYQVPDRVLAAESLPRGRTGKIDPKAVLAAFRTPMVGSSIQETSNPEDWEIELRRSISEILGLPRLALPNENFLQLGGNSLAAVAVSGRCRQLGAIVRPRDVLLSNRIGEFIEICRQARQVSEQDHDKSRNVFPKRGRITKSQSALIYASNESPGSNVIQTSIVFATNALPAHRKAWKRVLESESIFRTTFDLLEGIQTVHGGPVKFTWEEVAVTTREAYEADSRGLSMAFGVGTSFKIISFQGQCRLIWRIHHALIDGFSASLLLRKVYAALDDKPLSQGPSFLQLLDGIYETQASLSSTAKEFWNQQRLDVPNAVGKIELLPKPDSTTATAENMLVAAGVDGVLDLLPSGIKALANKFGVTPVTLFYVAWAILLSNYTGSTEVVFGAVLSGRDAMVADIEQTIGPLVCTASFRVLVDPTSSVKEFARQVFTKLHALSQYQWLPDEEDSSFFHTAVASQLNLPGQPVQVEDTHQTSTIPITLMIEGERRFRINYRNDTYTHLHMSRMAEGFQNIFLAMVRLNIDVGTCSQQMIPAAERLAMLHKSNCFSSHSFVDRSKDTVLDIFDRTVKAYPKLHAVQKGDDSVTYEQFDLASTKVARRIAQNISPGDVVCLHADRSIDWLVGVFGIIKAGGAYCPLDEALPMGVRVDIFTRSGATLFLAPTIEQLAFAPPSVKALLAVGQALEEQDGPDVPTWHRDPRAILYVCFTSGSSGKPKGVQVEHGGLVESQKLLSCRLHAAPGRRIMQFLSVGFDGSMSEIFCTLCYGSTLVLRPDTDDVLAALHEVDIATLTPSVAEGLDPRGFPNLKYLYFAGEPLTQQTVDLWAPGRSLYNFYGPTEATIGAILKPCAANEPVTIGKPISTMRAYILNDNQHLVPTGVVGEIVLAGVQVARGYVGMPIETKAKFLPDTISSRSAERMYLTGDLGYWTEEGEIVCLGRKDRQAKLRGFRISLSSVETAICMYHGVQTAAAAVSEGSLIAWVTPVCVDISNLQAHLSASLPIYARPQRIVALDSFPLTGNGKLDYKTLLTGSRRVLQKPTSADRPTGTEALIATEWRSLLNLQDCQEILSSDTFVSLGGHSMRQLALAARLSSKFGMRLPVRLILNCETLRELACAVDQARKSMVRQAVTGQQELGQVELSPVEEEWWLKYQVASPSAAATFNVPYVCPLSEAVDPSLLATAWSIVISRHSILSSRFAQDCKGRPYRQISHEPPRASVVSEIDVAKTIGKAFDLSTDDLVRVQVSSSKLLVVISHILCDLSALRILVNEVSIVYKNSPEAPLRPSAESPTFAEVSSWFDRPSPTELEFWSRYLASFPPSTSNGPATDHSGSSEVFPVAPDLFRKISSFAARHSATLYQTILVATAVTLQSLTQTKDIVLGTPYMNRTRTSDLNTVGLFLQPLPFRLNLSEGPDACKRDDWDMCSLMERAKSSHRGMLSHAIPWQQLLAHLGLALQRNGGTHPLFDTVVTLHDHREFPPVSLDIAGAGPSEYVFTTGTKFKLLFEYTVCSSGELLLRIEYSTQKLALEGIRTVHAGLLRCFEAMCEGSSVLDIQDATDTSGAVEGLRYGS